VTGQISGQASGPTVRHATRADVGPLTNTLVRAFHDDPMLRWLYPDEDVYTELGPVWFEFSLDVGLRLGHTYSVDDGIGGAIWSAPDVDLFDDATIGAFTELLTAHLPAERIDEVSTTLLNVALGHPHDEPHFYLFTIGTDPSRQGTGAGSALLRRVLDVCDAEGLPSYLESSNVRNVPFYERHGYRVTSEFPLPTGELIRGMWRRAQAA
jgi:GNAT superfamily N-acetyltransferase